MASSHALYSVLHPFAWFDLILHTYHTSNKTTPFQEPYTPNTNYNTRLYNDPTYATDILESTRCGRDNMVHAVNTETITIHAGDVIEFAHQRYEPSAWTDAMWYNCTDSRGSCNPARADVSTSCSSMPTYFSHCGREWWISTIRDPW